MTNQLPETLTSTSRSARHALMPRRASWFTPCLGFRLESASQSTLNGRPTLRC